jgi:hypothetical protein
MKFWILMDRAVNRLSAHQKGSVIPLVFAGQKRHNRTMENYQPSLTPTYTISVVNANDGSSEFPRPERLPQAGDVLVVEKAFRTKAGYVYHVGSKLRLIERTQDAPYGLLSSLGNWVVECPFQESVWTNIELMIAEGTLGYGEVPETEQWLPISTAPKEHKPYSMFVVIAMDVIVGNGIRYTSDPYCVWPMSGTYMRWPHSFPPTHWRPLPDYSPKTK